PSSDPRGARLAMARHPGVRQVLEQAGQILRPAEGGQRLRQLTVLDLAHREIEAQIDEHRLAARRHPEIETTGAVPPDERTPPDLARDQAASLGLGVTAADGADGGAEDRGQVTMRGETRSLLERAPGDVVRHRVRDGPVAGSGTMPQVGSPDCHGDNIQIDICFESSILWVVTIRDETI